MYNYIWIYRVLDILPFSVTVLILYLITMVAVFYLRDKHEGVFYNTSWGTMVGCGTLLSIVVMAAEILQRGAFLPSWLEDKWFYHLGVIILGFFIGSVMWWRDVRLADEVNDLIHWGEVYHHLVIVPLVCYLSVTLLPVIYLAGESIEKMFALCFILSWLFLVVYDFRSGRINQRSYLIRRGIFFQKEIPKKICFKPITKSTKL